MGAGGARCFAGTTGAEIRVTLRAKNVVGRNVANCCTPTPSWSPSGVLSHGLLDVRRE